MPEQILWKIVQEEHNKAHWGADALCNSLKRQIVGCNLYTTVTQITKQCKLCNNLQITNKPSLGMIGKGSVPEQQWQIDFSKLPRKGGYRYLLVLTGIFSGWLEAFPTWSYKVRELTKVLLNEITLRFGVPATISSDKDICFYVQVVQQISQIV